MTDPIQEFAERVVEKWDKEGINLNDLKSIIASELRAGGWHIHGMTEWQLLAYTDPMEYVRLAQRANPDADIGFISNT